MGEAHIHSAIQLGMGFEFYAVCSCGRLIWTTIGVETSHGPQKPELPMFECRACGLKHLAHPLVRKFARAVNALDTLNVHRAHWVSEKADLPYG